jgi:hypothetical protein
VDHWYIFTVLLCLDQEKSGDPDTETTVPSSVHGFGQSMVLGQPLRLSLHTPSAVPQAFEFHCVVRTEWPGEFEKKSPKI